jgi:hypothetical protein
VIVFVTRAARIKLERKFFMMYQSREKVVPLVFSALAISTILFVFEARAQTFGITNGNSFALIDPNSQAGMRNWTVDGVNQLYQQWFWYRIGNHGGESSIDTLSAATITSPGPGLLSTTYGNSKLSVEVDYALQGGSAGSGTADMKESITLRNVSTSTLSLHFFQYSDFDLLGSAADEHVELRRDGTTGPFLGATQWDGDPDNRQFAAHISVTPADHGEATFWPTLVNDLTDSHPTTLADTVGVVGSGGDVDCAFQWDLSLGVGGSVTLDVDKNLTLPTCLVPEPSTAALVGLGALGLVFFRRRSSVQPSSV